MHLQVRPSNSFSHRKVDHKKTVTSSEMCVCVCVPILAMTFPEWLSGTETLPHTPGAVRPSALCL